jgi:hypothetical protein
MEPAPKQKREPVTYELAFAVLWSFAWRAALMYVATGLSVAVLYAFTFHWLFAIGDSPLLDGAAGLVLGTAALVASSAWALKAALTKHL